MICVELEAVLNVINEAIRDQDRSLSKVKDRILALPTIEVESTKDGHWEVGYAPYGVVVHRCSLCGHTIATHEDSNYCPNCGARMDEVEE